MEVKKDIKGYNGKYKVSNFGNVYSYVSEEKKLKQFPSSSGYLRVSLYFNSIKKYHSVHRLVAEAFIKNPKENKIVNHKDENKKNNHYKNLEWCTYSENILHGNDIEKMLKSRTGKFKRKKVIQKDKKGNVIRVFKSVSEAAKYGFNTKRVSSVCRGETKTHKNFVFNYI